MSISWHRPSTRSSRAGEHVVKGNSERGQAMIFFAVVAATLMMMMGIAVEGGRLMVEYRHMQAAADMAALVGAEDLPYQTTQAVTDACAYMAKNGYDNCSTSSSSSTTTTVCVPPSSLTPYNFLQYNSDNTPCGTVANTSKFIEVQISEPLRVPIFNISFSLYTHAIARNGAYQPRDYAIAVLDPHQCRALSMSGSNTLLSVGPVISNSDATTGSNCSNQTPNSIYAQTSNGNGNTSYDIACDGEWDTAADEAYSTSSNIDGQLRSLKSVEVNGSITTGLPSYSPIGCWNAPPYDSTTDFNALTPPISDPYGGSCPPVASGTSGCQSSLSGVFPNCKACQDSPAWYYHWTAGSRWTGTWSQASSSLSVSGCCYELFPGEYKGGISFKSSGVAYLNPGVYTLDSGLSATSGGTMCVFGAPACDILNGFGTNALSPSSCTSYNFTSASPPDPTSASYQTSANKWYYYCSPYGFWDTDTCLGAGTKPCVTSVRPADTLTAPTFSNGTTPLNGVTFYLQNGTSNGGGMQTNGGSFIMAAPNPCPGNGTATTGSVPYNSGTIPPLTSGASNAVTYTYPTTANTSGAKDPAALSGLSPSSTTQLYPNVDLSIKEDSVCNTYFGGTQPTMWTNEFASNQGQHLHFMFFSRDGKSPINLVGNGVEYWRGIIYNPTAYSGSGNSYIVQLGGTSGGGTGPPLVTGQVIADDFATSGSATVEVFFRPCTPTQQCSSAPQIQLVE